MLTQDKLWFTIQADVPMNLLDLLKECSIRLIYLGNQRFGILMWRPRLPKKVALKSDGFNIIEEYTLDDALNPNKQHAEGTALKKDVDKSPIQDTSKMRADGSVACGAALPQGVSHTVGHVETSSGDDKGAPAHLTAYNASVTESDKIKCEDSAVDSASPLHVVTEAIGKSAATTEPEQMTMSTPPCLTTNLQTLLLSLVQKMALF